MNAGKPPAAGAWAASGVAARGLPRTLRKLYRRFYYFKCHYVGRNWHIKKYFFKIRLKLGEILYIGR